jgi:hypothetical protein
MGTRLRAFAIHLGVSAVVVALAAWLVFAVWYPFPYREISGGQELFLLVVGVDLVLGPLMTLLIFNRNKTRPHLAMDLSVIGLLQVAALCYGLWSVFVARPVHLVFEYHRMAMVHAVDVAPELLVKAPKGLQELPLTGPTLLSLRPLAAGAEEFESTMLAMAGIAQAAQPVLWQPYESARNDILKAAKPVAELKARVEGVDEAIDKAIRRTGRQADELSYLPMLSRGRTWTVLIDSATAQPVDFLAIDSLGR